MWRCTFELKDLTAGAQSVILTHYTNSNLPCQEASHKCWKHPLVQHEWYLGQSNLKVKNRKWPLAVNVDDVLLTLRLSMFHVVCFGHEKNEKTVFYLVFVNRFSDEEALNVRPNFVFDPFGDLRNSSGSRRVHDDRRRVIHNELNIVLSSVFSTVLPWLSWNDDRREPGNECE